MALIINRQFKELIDKARDTCEDTFTNCLHHNHIDATAHIKIPYYLFEFQHNVYYVALGEFKNKRQ